MHAPTAPAGGADRFRWVFLVPALNEQLTIRDSVDRLLAMEVVRQGIGVIGDDVTTQILVELAHHDLVVLRRDRPAVTGTTPFWDRYVRTRSMRAGPDRRPCAPPQCDGTLAAPCQPTAAKAPDLTSHSV